MAPKTDLLYFVFLFGFSFSFGFCFANSLANNSTLGLNCTANATSCSEENHEECAPMFLDSEEQECVCVFGFRAFNESCIVNADFCNVRTNHHKSVFCV